MQRKFSYLLSWYKRNKKSRSNKPFGKKAQLLRCYDSGAKPPASFSTMKNSWKTLAEVLQTQAPIVQRYTIAFFLFLTSLLLQRSHVDSLKLTSCEVESSSCEAPYPTRKGGNLNFPRFSREACEIAPKPMLEHWLIREKYAAKRNRWFSCNAV